MDKYSNSNLNIQYINNVNLLTKIIWEDDLLVDCKCDFSCNLDVLITYIKYYLYLCKSRNELPRSKDF